MGPQADSSGGRDSGFMETWLAHGRIRTSPVTYFMQYLFLLLVCVFNHAVLWDLLPSRHWVPSLWTVQRVPLCRPVPAEPLEETVALSWTGPVKSPAGGLEHLTACLMW